jgi:hypothetical protein
MKISDEQLEEINKALLLTFGYEDGFKARYRVSWTTGQEELRRGIYVKFDEHNNPLAEKVETKYVIKYPYSQDRYVLERLFYFRSDELPMALTSGSYEAVYYFEDGDKKPIPLTQDAVLAICRILEAPKVHKTAQDFKDEEAKQMKEQIERDYLYLEEHGRLAMFYDGAGVFIDSTKIKRD